VTRAHAPRQAELRRPEGAAFFIGQRVELRGVQAHPSADLRGLFSTLFIQRGRDANCEGSVSRDTFLF
jgi:hypothetical protein